MDGSNEDGSRRVRKKVTDTWTKRLIQRKKVAGEAHMNHVGNFVPERTTGSECRCRRLCMANISVKSRLNIIELFNKMENKNIQDTYLASLVTVTVPQRKRSRLQDPSKEHTAVFHYKVKYDGREKSVCKAAFLSLHGVSPSRIRRICVLIQQGVVFPKDLRGTLREQCVQPQTRHVERLKTPRSSRRHPKKRPSKRRLAGLAVYNKVKARKNMLEINIKCEPYKEEISQEEISEGDITTIKIEPDVAPFMTPKAEPEDWHLVDNEDHSADIKHIDIKEEILELHDNLQTPVMRPETSSDHVTRSTESEDPSEAICEESFEDTSEIKCARSNQMNSFRRHKKRFSVKMLKDELICVQSKQKARKSAGCCSTANAQTQFYSNYAIDSNFEFSSYWDGISVGTQACITDIKL